MYRQKNTVGNLENVGFSIDGHEGIYNVLMMEDVQTIFAVGAGAVSKLVDFNGVMSKDTRIKRIFNPKYPYEYLKRAEERNSDNESNRKSLMEETLEFFAENK